jgi:hypothetical protein
LPKPAGAVAPAVLYVALSRAVAALVWLAFVALVAESASEAAGTFANVDSLMSVPPRELSSTFEPLTAFFLILAA